MKLLIANVPSIVCIVIAGLVCALGQDGWGWFLLIALLLGHTYGDCGK